MSGYLSRAVVVAMAVFSLGIGVLATTATSAAAAVAAPEEVSAAYWWWHSSYSSKAACQEARLDLYYSGQYSLSNSSCSYSGYYPRPWSLFVNG